MRQENLISIFQFARSSLINYFILQRIRSVSHDNNILALFAIMLQLSSSQHWSFLTALRIWTGARLKDPVHIKSNDMRIEIVVWILFFFVFLGLIIFLCSTRQEVDNYVYELVYVLVLYQYTRTHSMHTRTISFTIVQSKRCTPYNSN